ncbi:MAG: hypothetical protein ACFFBV_14365 [Promethearchaeota archaeon]
MSLGWRTWGVWRIVHRFRVCCWGLPCLLARHFFLGEKDRPDKKERP